MFGYLEVILTRFHQHGVLVWQVMVFRFQSGANGWGAFEHTKADIGH